MLRPVTTSSASASAAPTAVHASAAATLSPHQSRATFGASDKAGVQAGGGSGAQTFRYNSFEFVYRQDVGRIVLIGQSPETGERTVQVPSEHALRAYERTAREDKQVAARSSSQTSAQQTAPRSEPDLAKAMVAAVSGDSDGSAVVSVSV